MQNRISMHAHQALARGSGFLASPREKQSCSWLTHGRLHSLIGRILSTTLERNFDARRIFVGHRWNARRNQALLPQPSRRHVKVIG